MSCDQAQEDKPKWLLELENRKRKPKLAHETGAGAPCLICEDACPGLELHFWRKICKVCKCRGDDHVIDDEDFPQFELLFGPNTKNRKNRSFALKINQKLQPHSPPTNFEWIPPNTTEELAADYMKSLPADKWPIASSAGAAVRRQQLKKQLPLHDIDHEACDALSEQERKEFDKYLDNLKNCAGQGRVLKFSIIKPFDKSLMTPANATDVQRNSPQHSQSLSNNANNGAGWNLRTPSSFIPKVPYSSQAKSSNLLANYAPSEENRPITPIKDAMRTTTHLQASHEQSPMGRYHQHHGGDGDRLQQQLDDVPRAAYGRSAQAYGGAASPSHLEHVRNRAMMADQDLARTGAAHHHQHHHPTSKAHSDYVQAQIDRIAAKQSGNNLENSSGLARVIRSETHPLDRASPQPDAYRIYPGSFDDRSNVRNPDHGQRYEGGSNDNNSNNVQDPAVIHGALQHSSVYPSMSISSEEARLDPERISGLSNKAENNRTTNAYHPDYLQARISSSLPMHSSTIQSELLNNPVFPEETVGGGGGGATFVQQNPDNIKQLQEGMEAMTMNTSEARHCYKCKAGIVSGGVVVTADKIKNAVWHPECFTCTACNELLVDLIYFTHKGNLYCARDLAELLEIPRCFACDEVRKTRCLDDIIVGFCNDVFCFCFVRQLIFVREYTVAEGHNYHVKHFCCWDCDIPLAGLQYVSENDRPLCLPCYQNNYAKMCAACRTVIAADQKGIAIKNLNFHATESCFCCATCRKSLLEGQLAVKDDKILCSKECIAEYLHRKAMGR
ncbi:unnamed protein product [Trichogramma brassicae]|uniref:LIM zinc-binding domain-containing protein n=1 Tax=Trichogramma brassicae TaxID=86971 RepID=A0A6H5ISA3_9HYME|nr:unnamed protein product [Trichogramma brassicae]